MIRTNYVKVMNHLNISVEESNGEIKVEAVKNATKETSKNRNVDIIPMKIENVFSSAGLLVSLNLSHCDLTDFPEIFGNIQCLKKLNLSHNKLTEVPQCIYTAFDMLEDLDLSYNVIKEFSGLPKCFIGLKVLRLNNNHLSAIPEFIMKVCCYNLEEFYYSHNVIWSLESSQFRYGGSYKLKTLEMRNSYVTGKDLIFLTHIRTLRNLDLSNDVVKLFRHFRCKNHNRFQYSDSFEKIFEDALWNKQLHVLKLNNLRIADLPRNIHRLVFLQELHLTGNWLMILPDSITLLSELKVLNVSENELYKLPNNMYKLKKLQVLKAHGNVLSELPDLKSLNITYLDLYDNNLEHCSINWDIVVMIDLERNYLKTCDMCIENYNEKKAALRKTLNTARLDISKKIDCSEDEDDFNASNESNSIEMAETEEISVDSHFDEFAPTYVEESWSSESDCDLGDPECTASDNEWKGTEEVLIKKNIKIPYYMGDELPSWRFADVD